MGSGASAGAGSFSTAADLAEPLELERLSGLSQPKQRSGTAAAAPGGEGEQWQPPTPTASSWSPPAPQEP